MKILTHILPVVLASCLLAGCVGETSICRVNPVPANTPPYQGKTVVGTIEAENRGVFLFGCLPLWTGHPYRPNRRLYTTFRNYLTEGYQRHMLDTAARKAGAELVDVRTRSIDSWLYTLGILWFCKLESHGVLLGAEAPHDR